MSYERNNYNGWELLSCDRNPLVSETMFTLCHEMGLAASTQNRILSDGMIVYICQAVIRALLLERPDYKLAADYYPLPDIRIRVVNVPQKSSENNLFERVRNRFIDICLSDSELTGEELDVSFAASLFAAAFDMDCLPRHVKFDPHSSPEAYDQWISGFVINDEDEQY